MIIKLIVHNAFMNIKVMQILWT